MVELQPSKLAMRVRFPSPAPAFARPPYINGSSSTGDRKKTHGEGEI
jgi:hypothetical protein